MSEVKQYDIAAYNGGMDEIVDGNCVLFSDFDRVTAERDAALRQVETITADRDAEKQMKAKARIQRDVQTAKATDLQNRLTAADERADTAITALNEIAKVSRMGEKPFEIATLAIGEMSAPKPAEDHPCPVSLDGCDGSCAP